MTGHLSETQESFASVEARLVDHDAVLNQATSEGTTLSCAMEKNVRLKPQLAAFQNALDHVLSCHAFLLSFLRRFYQCRLSSW